MHQIVDQTPQIEDLRSPFRLYRHSRTCTTAADIGTKIREETLACATPRRGTVFDLITSFPTCKETATLQCVRLWLVKAISPTSQRPQKHYPASIIVEI